MSKSLLKREAAAAQARPAFSRSTLLFVGLWAAAFVLFTALGLRR